MTNPVEAMAKDLRRQVIMKDSLARDANTLLDFMDAITGYQKSPPQLAELTAEFAEWLMAFALQALKDNVSAQMVEAMWEANTLHLGPAAPFKAAIDTAMKEETDD